VPDVPVPDLSVPDVPVPDLSVPDTNTHVPDMVVWMPDLIAPDGITAQSACTNNTSPVQIYAANMVKCGKTSSYVKHCNAESYCNTPRWHICTGTEFLARGGATTPSGSTSAWIGACVTRGGAKTQAPKDGLCPDCPQRQLDGVQPAERRQVLDQLGVEVLRVVDAAVGVLQRAGDPGDVVG
jgi:hypothetical protein